MALTAAALATPSAFGYGYYAESGENYGFVVNATSAMAAMTTAIGMCIDRVGGGVEGSCRINVTPFTNVCFAVAVDASSANPSHTHLTRGDAHTTAQGFCTLLECLPNDMPIDLSGVDVCDHTCDAADNQFIVDNPEDNAGCREARINSECEMVDSATPIFDSMLGDNGECRERTEMDCATTEVFVESTKTCRERTQMDCATTEVLVDATKTCRERTEMDCSTTEVFVESTKTCRERMTSDCAATEILTGGNCTACTEENTSPNDNQTACQLDEIAADGFTFDGETGNTGKTAETPISVAFADRTSVAIAIMPPLTVDLTYERISGDEELVVSEAGVVSFTSDITITAGMYSIFVEAAETGNTDNIVATISVFLQIAAAIDGGNGGDNGGTTTSSGGGGGGSAAGIIGGVVVVALALWYFTSGSDDLTWTPSYAFANNNGNVSYSVGSRWTATANDWNLYWQTRQNGDRFVYGSGMRYNNGILSAAMNSESENDKTDLDLNLSANKTIGVWDFGGGYQFDMQLSDDATESQNLLNAKVRYTVDKWILSANANTDGKKAAARINYSYRF